MEELSSAAWSVESLCDQACGLLAPNGRESFGFLDALDVLLESLAREARLTPSGLTAAHAALIRSLTVQGRMRRHLEEHPEVTRHPIESPVFIIGLPRTGSTLLHNLMAQHSRLHCPQLWELISPYGDRDPQAQQQAQRTAEVFLSDLYERAPRLRRIHFMDAGRPDECHRLLANTFESGIFWLRYRIPSYAEWLSEQNLDAAYASHRSQLQSLTWRIPTGIPVLKCPFHVWGLDALTRTYPGARFIYLHRDPKEVISSTGSLCATLRSARSDAVDKREIGHFCLQQIARILDDWPALRALLAGSPVIDIRYRDLLTDPLGAARRACTFAGAPATLDDENRMLEYLDANPQGLHGDHKYSTDEFGIDADTIDEKFAGYRREYALGY